MNPIALWRRLVVATRGRPLRGAERYGPFFIVGSGRCGSTLLRAMLEVLPDVHISPGMDVGGMLREYRRYSRLPWRITVRLILSRVEYDGFWAPGEVAFASLYQQLCGFPPERRNLAAVVNALQRAHARGPKPVAARWGDKTPLSTPALPGLRRVFPDLQAVHLLRDGRDVVQSFMRSSGMDLARAADVWLRHVRAARAFGARHPDQYLEVRYEDLVRDPRAALERVTTFLGLRFDERMLRHHEAGLDLGDVDRFPQLQGVRRAVYASSVGLWRTSLDARQVAEVDRLLGATLSRLGYEDGG